MKKSLTALAVLGVFAGSAMAADVTLYGALDTGFEYFHKKTTQYDGSSEKSDTFDMQTGWDTGNRWGLKGSEDLGNGYKVSFKLESGFNSDDGTYDMLGYVESFDGGDGDVWGFAASDRYDNMVVYQTPRFAGLQATVQYSFKTDSKDDAKYSTTANADGEYENHFSGDEGTSHAKRYASIGLSGEYGPASFAVGYELTKYGANEATFDGTNVGPGVGRQLDKDGHLVFIGGNYDFEVVQLFAEAQYFKNQTATATVDAVGDRGLKGYGLHVGAAAPIGAGTLTAGLYYADFSDEEVAENVDRDYTYYGVSARYNYPLSTRTGVYVGAGYGQTKGDALAGETSDYKDQVTQVYCGLVHTF